MTKLTLNIEPDNDTYWWEDYGTDWEFGIVARREAIDR